MKKEVLKEKIVKILEGINEPVKTNYEIADQILELLKSEKEKWENLTLERIKLKEETKLFDEDEWSEGYKGGYNQAIGDLEKIKEKIKKNYVKRKK